ncbi:MAG: 50S ribosomal protein L24 [Bacteroidetes bacterium QS_8_68_28]|nr:MAG: 50S ribosomal protein L24 [Bacteroidetes bacterium QS_8_68_28]
MPNPKVGKLHVKKNDDVRVIAGNYRGVEGRILKVFPDDERVIVEGVNVRVHHMQPSQQNPDGGRIEKEVPIHVSNVMPVDSNGDTTRVGRKRVENPDTGKGRWVRYAKTTGEELDQ